MADSGVNDMNYLLMIKDDISGYIWLYPSINADSDAASRALAKSITAFGSMYWLASDQGAHFSASKMKSLTVYSYMNYHLTTAYYL